MVKLLGYVAGTMITLSVVILCLLPFAFIGFGVSLLLRGEGFGIGFMAVGIIMGGLVSVLGLMIWAEGPAILPPKRKPVR
jgi:hypothetical protein